MTAGMLRQNAVPWWYVSVLSVAFISPAAAVLLNTPLAGASFYAIPSAFLLALATVMLNANSVMRLSAIFPNSGGHYAYAALSLGPRIGFLSGWMLVFGYFFLTVAGICMFIALASQFLMMKWAVIDSSWLLLLLIVVYVVPISVYGIREVVESALLFLAVEFIVMLMLAASVLAARSQLVLPALHQSLVPGHWADLRQPLLFGGLTFIGLESGAVLAEEVRNPSRSVPRGILAAGVVVGIFFFVVTLAGTVGYSADSRGLTSGPSPFSALAEQYWGTTWAYVVLLVAIMGVLVFVLVAVNALARTLYFMARDWKHMRHLATTSKRTGTPVAALAVVSATSALVSLIVIATGNVDAASRLFGKAGAVSVFLVYLTLNVALMSQWLRHAMPRRSLTGHLIIPLAATALLAVALTATLPGLSDPASVFVWAALPLAWLLAGILCFELRSIHNPDEVRDLGRGQAPMRDVVSAGEGTAAMRVTTADSSGTGHGFARVDPAAKTNVIIARERPVRTSGDEGRPPTQKR